MTGPYTLRDRDNVLDPEDFRTRTAAEQRTAHPLWAPRPWSITGPDGKVVRHHQSHIHVRRFRPAAEGVEEWQWLGGDRDPVGVCRRLGVHPRTVIRWHQRLGLPLPPHIWRVHDTWQRVNHDHNELRSIA